MSECIWPGCSLIQSRGGLCFRHAGKMDITKPAKVIKFIPQRSEKRIKEQKVYVGIVSGKLKEDNRCEIKSPVCTGGAQGLDHTQGRSPANFLAIDNLKRACNACNLFKELNPGWAKENGHTVSRFEK